MASHFKWYPSDSETVVPFNARYAFPSQANKAVKMTPRIPPKNSQDFKPGTVIRLEFPAQVGYFLILGLRQSWKNYFGIRCSNDLSCRERRQLNIKIPE